MADYDWGPPPVDGFEVTINLAFVKNTGGFYKITPDVLKFLLEMDFVENPRLARMVRLRGIEVSEYREVKLAAKSSR